MKLLGLLIPSIIFFPILIKSYYVPSNIPNAYSMNEMYELRNQILSKCEIVRRNPNKLTEFYENTKSDFEYCILHTGAAVAEIDSIEDITLREKELSINSYLDRPPFLFYTCNRGINVIRLLGIIISGDGIVSGSTAVAKKGKIEFLSIDLNNLIPVKKWNKEQKKLLLNNGKDCNKMFCEKKGYLELCKLSEKMQKELAEYFKEKERKKNEDNKDNNIDEKNEKK